MRYHLSWSHRSGRVRNDHACAHRILPTEADGCGLARRPMAAASQVSPTGSRRTPTASDAGSGTR